MSYKLENNQPLDISREIGAGGEAVVYALKDDSKKVAKLYRKPDITKTAKLRAMLANPPVEEFSESDGSTHISIAWPDQLVFDPQHHCVGFLMPYINGPTNVELSKLYNPQDRRQNAPGFTWKYLLRAARNISQVLESLHNRGHVVGDLNESNWLVSNAALVTLVDCDSIQVTVKNESVERVYRCPVGKAEYTPPELQGCNFNLINRNPNHDNFSLAVLVFLLLMEGVHPYQGRWIGEGEPPGIVECIERGLCPYVSGQSQVKPPAFGLPFTILSPAIQTLMIRCFGEGHKSPSKRPKAAEWYHALKETEENLTNCVVNSQHFYSNHLASCPWCERVKKGLADSFPPKEQLARILEEAKLPRSKRQTSPRSRPAPATTLRVGTYATPARSRANASTANNRTLSPRGLWNFTWAFFALMTVVITILINVISVGNKTATTEYYANFNQTINAAKPAGITVANQLNTLPPINDATATALTGRLQGNILDTPVPEVIRTPAVVPKVSLVLTLSGHTGEVNTVAFSPDGKMLASGSNDKTVKLWNTSTGQELPTLITNFNNISSVAFDPIRNILLSVGAYGPVKFWNTNTGKEIAAPNGSSLRYANTVLFSYDGKTLITTDAYDAVFYHIDSTGRFNQTGTLPLAARRDALRLETIVPLTLSQSGNILALENQDHSLSLLDSKTLMVQRTLFGHADKVLTLAISQDGKTLASGGNDKLLIIWDTTTGQQLHNINNVSVISSVAFSPDGGIVASGSYDGSVKLWDVASGKLLKTVTTDSGRILTVAFSPDGKTLAEAGTDKIIKLWSISR